MHYDIAIKRLMELGSTSILREVVGMEVTDLRMSRCESSNASASL